MDANSWAESVCLIPIEPRGKKPLVPWAEFQGRLSTPTEREEWSRRYPGCNWGLVTGKISGVVALDFDGEEGLALRKDKNVFGSIPTSLTGKGCHCLFRHPGREIRNGTRLLPGLDFRGDGGYIVVPPSVHPSGKVYEWQVAPWMVAELLDLPEWVWPLVSRAANAGTSPGLRSEPVSDGLPPGVAQGARNAAAARVAGSLFKKGIPEAGVLAVMREWNKKNRPPLYDDELIRVVRSIANAEHRQHPPTPMVSGEEFLSERIEKPKTLVDPIILDPARVVLAGFAGVGKTSLAMNLAAAVSAGKDFLGWRTARKTVLYVDGENPRILVQNRARTILDAIGGDIRNIHFSMPEKKLNLGDGEGRSRLEDMISHVGAGLVVLDSSLNFYSLKSENDSVEVRGALDGLTDLMRSTECTILILDHTMKPLRYLRGIGEIGPPTPRGSGAKVDFADVVLVLEAKKGEGRDLKTLHFTKLRGARPMRPLVLEMDGRMVFHPVHEDSAVPVDLVLRLVEESPGMRTGEVLQELLDRTGASERTVYSAISRAERQKMICRVPRGRAMLIYPYTCVSELVEKLPHPGSELVASLLNPEAETPQPEPIPPSESLQMDTEAEREEAK